MSLFPEVKNQLSTLGGAELLENVPLANYTRFSIGGPAAMLLDATEEAALIRGTEIVRTANVPYLVIGGGTNLIVSDDGFHGVVVRYSGRRLLQDSTTLEIESGALLQSAVDESIARGLRGLETMTGIPGFLGGAVYGNAGAYGHSTQELVTSVRMFDGSKIRVLTNEDCRFGYRESVFKTRKDWIILSARLQFTTADSAQLARTAQEIRAIRDAKYPPAMKCAGSIFKNLLVRNLPAEVVAQVPPNVIREGKVPSAWFLDQVEVKGMRKGDIQIATYHANLLYNDGHGKSSDLVSLIQEVKARVCERFGFQVEEEVQYVGF
jgi:UDP-N-acetylmuramate dehydrogenase